MAYGLKCFSPQGYTSFDSSAMLNFLKVITSGTVTVSGSSTSPTISAPSLDYIYIWSGEVTQFNDSTADRYEIVNRTSSSFRIRNKKTSSRTFYYIAFTR